MPQIGDDIDQCPTRKLAILPDESSLAHAASLGFRGFSYEGYLKVVALVKKNAGMRLSEETITECCFAPLSLLWPENGTI